MYVPAFNAMPERDPRRALVDAVGTALLITASADQTPAATLLPVIWDGPAQRLVFHLARANPHWRGLSEDQPALAVVTGPEAYVSPAWYPSKAEHGRAVPTWNYSSVEFAGRLRVHHDPGWLREAVTRLSDQHEAPRAERGHEAWQVTDAPERFVTGQLRAIVGVELLIDRIEGKAKLSQNRSAADVDGVIAGLHAEGGAREAAVADAMRDADDPRDPATRT